MTASNNCTACLRWSVFVLNLLFWLAGIGVLAVALWLLFDGDYAKKIGENTGLNDFYTGVYILIGVGVVMTVLGFLGCCGALMQSQILLTAFFIILLLVFIAELVCGILMYYYQEDLRKYVSDSMRDAVIIHYRNNKAYQEVVDTMQEKLECCGARSYRDWFYAKKDPNADASFAGANDEPPGIAPWNNILDNLPRSCCTEKYPGDYPINCGADFIKDWHFEISEHPLFYQKGCNQALFDRFYYNSNVIIGLAIGIGCFQLLGMVLTMALCCVYNYEARESKYNRNYD